ncbi:MAG: hypothetical protein ABI678_09655 [Kofleriaceae bacterium]
MTRTAPVTPLPWQVPALPARSPHITLALFLALCSIACPPLGSLAWWYASTELSRVAAGELWPEHTGILIFAKGCGVAATTACATFLACAAVSRFG